MKPTTRLKLENVIRRLIRESWEDDSNIFDNQMRKNRLTKDELKIVKVLEDKYRSEVWRNFRSFTASDWRNFLEKNEPNLVDNYLSIRMDDVIEYITNN